MSDIQNSEEMIGMKIEPRTEPFEFQLPDYMTNENAKQVRRQMLQMWQAYQAERGIHK